MFYYKLFSVAFIACIIVSAQAQPLFSYSSSSSSSSSMDTINGVSTSVNTVINNGKYMIIINNGDCMYKQGKIIENDNIRSMTKEENWKLQMHLNGEISLPCFCATC